MPKVAGLVQELALPPRGRVAWDLIVRFYGQLRDMSLAPLFSRLCCASSLLG